MTDSKGAFTVEYRVGVKMPAGTIHAFCFVNGALRATSPAQPSVEAAWAVIHDLAPALKAKLGEVGYEAVAEGYTPEKGES